MEPQAQEQQAPQLYGTSRPSIPKTFREKLADKFGSSDFVRVINPDNETYYWQSLDPRDEEIYIDKGPTKVTRRNPPKIYSIKAGESIVLPGWNAYIMIEGLYKKLAQKKAVLEHPENKTADGKPVDISFGWSDDAKQDFYIAKIYVGIEQPTFGGQTVTNNGERTAEDTQRSVSADEVLARGLEQSLPKNVYDKAMEDLGLRNGNSES